MHWLVVVLIMYHQSMVMNHSKYKSVFKVVI